MTLRSQCGRGVLWVALAALFGSPVLWGQTQDSPGSPGSQAAPSASATEKTQASPSPAQDPEKKSENKQELSMQDTGPTFKVRVNLVQVRAVVRDSSNKPVENLRREDFLLYDQGKLQGITTFNVETTNTRKAKSEAAAKTQENGVEKSSDATLSLPERFVALVFDDAHLTMEDANFSRVSAGKFLDSISPNDRVAIYTTSGQITQEFTSDKEALKKTLLGILPRALMDSGRTECPDVSHYMADQIENQRNDQVFAVVVEETIQCQFNGDRSKIAFAQSIARGASMRALNAGDTENNFTYRHLEDILRRLSGMPGERVMLMVSPGFQLASQYLDEMGIIDRANRANVVINTLDARGLYTPEVLGDISRRNGDTLKTGGYKTTYRVAAQSEATNVLRDFAYGTGGTYFGNSNDLAGGLRVAGTAPETSYVLGFSPQNQKMDGRYHTIKVSLAGKQKYSIQARRGYYAPKKVNDPLELAKAEIQEAVFSQEEIGDLPLELQTQYFKTEQAARLSVVSHLGMKSIHFRKADGRNVDNLTMATAIFDENGNYVTGGEKILEMKLRDTTYERMSRTGLTVKSSFDVKPGRYLVRQVVRDSEGAQMAARNGAVEIPY
jgi:VWFA-related protein